MFSILMLPLELQRWCAQALWGQNIGHASSSSCPGRWFFGVPGLQGTEHPKRWALVHRQRGKPKPAPASPPWGSCPQLTNNLRLRYRPPQMSLSQGYTGKVPTTRGLSLEQGPGLTTQTKVGLWGQSSAPACARPTSKLQYCKEYINKNEIWLDLGPTFH